MQEHFGKARKWLRRARAVQNKYDANGDLVPPLDITEVNSAAMIPALPRSATVQGQEYMRVIGDVARLLQWAMVASERYPASNTSMCALLDINVARPAVMVWARLLYLGRNVNTLLQAAGDLYVASGCNPRGVARAHDRDGRCTWWCCHTRLVQARGDCAIIVGVCLLLGAASAPHTHNALVWWCVCGAIHVHMQCSPT